MYYLQSISLYNETNFAVSGTWVVGNDGQRFEISNIIEKPHTLAFFTKIKYVCYLQVFVFFCSNLVEYYGINDTDSNFQTPATTMYKIWKFERNWVKKSHCATALQQLTIQAKIE